MNIRLLSDLHIEFGYPDIPEMKGEDQQVLVLAGDISIASKPHTFKTFLHEMSERFRDIIYIMGNHEHYRGSVRRSLDKIKRTINATGEIHNVHVVNNEVVHIDDVSFVCSTLWASYDNGNPMTLWNANQRMNDHVLIRTGPKSDPYKVKFTANDAYAEHSIAKNFIFPTIKEEKEDGQKVCVVTHHAPSWESIHEMYRSGDSAKVNGAYASTLEDDILDAAPDLWVHGHVHNSFAYEIGDTVVVCNPRGYTPHYLNPDFDPKLILTLD